MPFSFPTNSSTNSDNDYTTMDSNQRLPPIQTLLQHQDVLADQLRRLSTGSSSSEGEDEHMSHNRQTLPPINQITSESYKMARRGLGHVNSHFHPYAPVSGSSLGRKSRRSRCNSTTSDSEETRNTKAVREQKARGKQIVVFSRLQRTLRNINPALENEWTPLKSNNIADIDDPLRHNKIDVLVSSDLLHQHQHGMLLDLVHYLHEEGHESKAREVARNMNTVGSRFEPIRASL